MAEPLSYIQVSAWFHRAQIDHSQHYLCLYTAFNAWYRHETGLQNDRLALNILRDGCWLWREYQQGRAMISMRSLMVLLMDLTQREPLSHATPHWRGEVQNPYDWTSLLEYWYRVRCLVVHGSEVRAPYVYLAYETLNLFMTELLHSSPSKSVYNTSKTSYN